MTNQNTSAGGDIRREITDRIIEALERGTAPWQRPWGATAMRPMNPTTGNGYRGINFLLLLSLDGNGRGDNRWMTYAQAAKHGWQVRKGEHGRTIIKVIALELGKPGASESPQPDTDAADKASERRFALRRYTVFNAEQIDGIPPLPENSEKDFEPCERADRVLEALKVKTGLTIMHGGAEAFYQPKLDLIRLPPKKAFRTAEGYFSVALHEAGHSTGNEKRIGRDISSRFGTEGYAAEELRAEISSAVLAAELGIPLAQSQEHIDQHSSYIASWIKVLRDDKLEIFRAAKDAEKICDYLLGLEREYSMEMTAERNTAEPVPLPSAARGMKQEPAATLSL